MECNFWGKSDSALDMEMNYVKLCSKLSLTMLPEESTSVNVNHSLSQSGQAIYYLRPSTLAQWQYASQQQNSLLITKKVYYLAIRENM